MTREEFHLAVSEAKVEYIKAAEDFINALLEDDFETALKRSLLAPELFGNEVMAYIAKKMDEVESYEEIKEEYDKKVNEVVELMMDE
jgi:limonene-1,2-epoxide hydrolase